MVVRLWAWRRSKDVPYSTLIEKDLVSQSADIDTGLTSLWFRLLFAFDVSSCMPPGDRGTSDSKVELVSGFSYALAYEGAKTKPSYLGKYPFRD